VFCSVAITRTLGKSKVTQKVALFEGCPEVFLEWIADWQQEKVLLKVPYHTATGATSVAADIAFGAIERSTVPTAPGDKARHEKICHKYFDLSTPGKEWGVAMLNDGKYAFDAAEGTMRLTMLRSPEYPGPAGEAFVNKEREARLKKNGTVPPKYSAIGPFKCRYALLPHEGGALADASGKPNAVVKRAAEEFNQPVVVVPVSVAVSGTKDSMADGIAMLEIKPANVMASAVKMNEWDANGNVIFRFLETSGFPADVSVSVHPALAKKAKSARMVDLLERPTGAPCKWDAAKGVLSFKSGKFEACTIELVLG
jgi:alpha-mannosidase